MRVCTNRGNKAQKNNASAAGFHVRTEATELGGGGGGELERESMVCVLDCVCVREKAGMGRSLCWLKFIFCFLKDDREGKKEKSCAATIAKEEKLVLFLSGKPMTGSLITA